MVRLSIIIPALGTERNLEDTLVSVLSNRPQNCEVLVVFRGPYDDPYDLSDEVRFVETSESTDRIGLANAGIVASRGEVLHLLDAGTEVVEGWTESPLRCFAFDSSVAAVSPLVVAPDRSQVVSAGVRCAPGNRRRVIGNGGSVSDLVVFRNAIDGPTFSAGFYRRAALVLSGGFDRYVGAHYADVDLAVCLRQRGHTCVFDPSCRIFMRQAPTVCFPVGFWHGRFAERFFWRHWTGEGRLRWLMVHLAHVAIDAFSQLSKPSSVTQLAGRLVGLGDVIRGTHHRSVDLSQEANEHLRQTVRATERERRSLREAG